MNGRIISIFAFAAAVAAQSCNITNSSDDGEGYPTTIRPLESSQLQLLQQRFDSQNEYRICFELDKYGALDFKLCEGRPVLRVAITEDNSASVSKAKSMLLQNREFTGVVDTSRLVVSRIHQLDGCIRCDGSPGDIKTINRGIDFEAQDYQGLEIIGSEFYMILDAEGVIRVSGRWYENVVIPPVDRWSEDLAKNSLVGKPIVFFGTGGPDTVTIGAADLLKPARKVIMKHEVNGNIELRVAWEIPVGRETPVWNVYVDTTTGEELGTLQLLLT